MEPSTSTSSSISTYSTSSVITTKRKLEDAIRTLDGAVIPSELSSTIDRPTPSKRPHVTRSLYSTLAKYGVKSKEEPQPTSNGHPMDVSKSAPHLAAILARAATRSQQASSFIHSSAPPTHPSSEYRPSSTQSFLSRLATYKMTTYANKPPEIDAVAAARCGWTNDGKDRLVCGICDISWVLAGREGMNTDAASALVERQRVSLVEMHKDGCPWKNRQCDPSVYRVSLQAPAAMARELRATAISLEPALAGVAIKHPLTPLQLNSVRRIFDAIASEKQSPEVDFGMDVNGTTQNPTLSETTIVTSLFGWAPAPPAAHRELRRTCSSFSISRAGSYGPSASMPPTPSISRSSSISRLYREREGTPTPSASPRISISQFSISPDHQRTISHLDNSWSGSITASPAVRDTSLVYCALCQRRVGLWGYSKDESLSLPQDGELSSTSRQPSKQFDLVKEHRSYCPYIVSSTVVHSYSQSPRSPSHQEAIEGWRAVLAVVQRYELSQRQRLSRFLPRSDVGNQTSSTELQDVEAMVAGVKSSGGRELLRYVRNLLG